MRVNYKVGQDILYERNRSEGIPWNYKRVRRVPSHWPKAQTTYEVKITKKRETTLNSTHRSKHEVVDKFQLPKSWSHPNAGKGY
jgi:hypothetical protein